MSEAFLLFLIPAQHNIITLSNIHMFQGCRNENKICTANGGGVAKIVGEGAGGGYQFTCTHFFFTGNQFSNVS